MEKRLLIIGSLGEFVELVKLSKQRGYYTVCCDGYVDGPAKKYADASYTIDVRNVDEIVAMCKRENINGIMGSFSDLIFEQITKIAEKANIKWYMTPDKLKFYREKNEAKKALAELGVCVPKNCILKKDFKDEELEGYRFPLVIKPINGYGSKGIFVVNTVEEIREKYDQVVCRANMDDIQVEEFSSGREYNMMTWLINGEVNVISIADREKNPQLGDTIPLLNRVAYPAKAIREIINPAKEVLQKFANFTGQKEGALSMQFFYNENGVEVCEIAGRLFGYEHELVTNCCGLSIEKLLLDYVYEPDTLKNTLMAHNPFFTKYAAGLYFVGIQGMKIKDQSKILELGKNSHVKECIVFYNEGDIIDNYGPRPYLSRYYIQADSREELDFVTQDFFDKFSVLSEDGSEISRKFILEK